MRRPLMSLAHSVLPLLQCLHVLSYSASGRLPNLWCRPVRLQHDSTYGTPERKRRKNLGSGGRHDEVGAKVFGRERHAAVCPRCSGCCGHTEVLGMSLTGVVQDECELSACCCCCCFKATITTTSYQHRCILENLCYLVPELRVREVSRVYPSCHWVTVG